MFGKIRFEHLPFKTGLRATINILALVFICATAGLGQFSSGSTGADGAFNPTVNTTLQTPESGVFNFTTVNIPINIQVFFTRNSRNTPITILATGDITIRGRIFLDGLDGNGRFGGLPGNGGYKGGNGGTPIDVINGTAGDGPGGGGGGIAGTTAAANGGGAGFLLTGVNGSAGGNGTGGSGGIRYGTKTLLPLIGGSGGGGGSSVSASQIIGGGGGGGGGAILLASSGTISFPDNGETNRGISARGAVGAFGFTNQVGGAGSGGAIRLVANTIVGNPCLDVSTTNAGAPLGSTGIIRIEAFNLSQYIPRCSSSSQTLGNPNPVTIPDTPTIRITSVGGIAAPAIPVGSNSAVNPDIVVPTSVPNPVQVAIQATNIPVGTVLQVRLTPESGAATVVNSTALSGTAASSNATASLTLPASGISVIRAFVTLDVTVAFRGTSAMIDGEKITKIELSTAFGGKTETVYILESGRRISEFK